jgi:hypothetical protein
MKIIKKTTLFLLIAILCIPLFSLYASAGKISTVTFSEDFSTMVLDGTTYSKVNALYLSNPQYTKKIVEFIPTETQEKTVLKLDVFPCTKSYVVNISIIFKNGDCLESHYVPQDKLQNFNAQMDTYPDKLYITNYPYYGKEKVFSYSLLKDDITSGETVTINMEDVYYSGYEVCGYDDGLYFLKGLIFQYGKNYYYVDCKKSNIVSPNDFDFFEKTVNAVKITSPELIEILGGESSEDEEISFIIIPTVFCILFSVVTLILGIVLTIITKKTYRKLWATTAALSLLEIIMLVVLIAIS